MAAAKVAPGPQPPLPLHPQQPHPPSPHGFLFPSPHSPPTSHCLASSLWKTWRHLTVIPPTPQRPACRSPSLLDPRTPFVWAPESSSPFPRGPAHPACPRHIPTVSVPLRAWKSSNTNGRHHAAWPCPRVASLGALSLRHVGTAGAPFLGRRPQPLPSSGWCGSQAPLTVQNGAGQTDTGPETTAHPA